MTRVSAVGLFEPSGDAKYIPCTHQRPFGARTHVLMMSAFAILNGFLCMSAGRL